MENNFNCIAFTHHLALKEEGIYRPCCNFEGQLKAKVGVEELLFEPAIAEFRKLSAAGNPILGCRRCYEQEARGQASIRQLANKNLKWATEGAPVALRSLELWTGDNCNLKCATCSPQFSSKWQEDLSFFPNQIPRDGRPWPIEKLKTILPELRAIKFVGGEPLLSSYHDAILRAVSDEQAATMELSYYTNATVPPARFLAAWKRFRRVEVKLSIDGFSELNSYIRFPAPWSRVEKNALDFWSASKNLRNLDVSMHSTVSLLNILRLRELSDWWRATTSGEGKESFNPIYEPSALSAVRLPKELRSNLFEKLSIPGPFLEEETAFAASRAFIDRLDANRGMRFIDLVPEFISVF